MVVLLFVNEENGHREQLNSACPSWVGRAVSSRRDHRRSSAVSRGSSAAPGREGGKGGRERGGAGHPSPRRAVPAALGQGGAEGHARIAVRGRSPSHRAGMSGDHSRSLGKGKRRGAAERGLAGRAVSAGGDSPSPLPAGSAAPGPVPAGLVRLYSMRFCPYAQRTRLVLRAKGVR